MNENCAFSQKSFMDNMENKCDIHLNRLINKRHNRMIKVIPQK